jgi:hypothetical protein
MKWPLALVVCLLGCEPVPQLVDVADEPAGEHCEHGGTSITIGFDDDHDGVIDASEIDSVEYVCDGGPGGDATDMLVETREEPAGANCSAGGTAIATGLDADADGTLDPSEIANTVFVCNAADGTITLVATRPEPAGATCRFGGTAILVGLDLDADGVLDPDEVTSTSFVCDGTLADPDVLHANVVIANDLDIALLAGVREIDGSLDLETAGSGLTAIALPDLEHVGFLVAFHIQPSSTLAFPRLVTAARLVVAGSVTALELPMLQTVDADLSLVGPVSPLELRFPELRSAGIVTIESGQTVAIAAPKLERTSTLELFAPELTSLDLRALTAVDRVRLSAGPGLALANVQLPPVTTLPNGFTLSGVPWDSPGPFATLQSTSFLEVSVEPMTVLAFPNLATVTGLEIASPTLQQLQLPALTMIGNFVIVTTPLLSTCQITAILAQANFTGPTFIQAGPCP